MKKKLFVLSLILLLNCSTLVNATTYTSVDEGLHGGTYGSNTYHSTANKVEEISVSAPFFEVHGWAWLGVELELDSSESVSMSASLSLTGYMNGGLLRIWFRCIDTEDYYDIEWENCVYDKTTAYTWTDDTLTLDLNNFPETTSSGTWIFLVHYEFYGSWGQKLQLTSADTGRSVLEIASITITY
jgi:hypothetical protein